MSGWVLIDEDDDVFDALRHNRQILLDAEMRELALIAQACDEWSVDESRADAAAERLIQGGSDGTANIGEFLALELGGLLQISPTAAALRIRDTLNLRDRHPHLWAHVHTGGVRPWQALKIVQRCAAAGLAGDAARWVDRQLMTGVTALGWTRTVRCLDGLIVKADPALAQQRAQQRHEERRVFVGDHTDGSSTLYARLDTETALALNHTIDTVAAALATLGNNEPADQRRATALGILADPQAAHDLLTGHGDGTPTNHTATLILHLSAESLLPASKGGVTRVEGIGPLDTATLRRLLGASRVTIRPTVDLNDIPALDSYEIPDRLRAHLLARNPVEAFPFSTRPSAGLDLDHTIPYNATAPPGSRQTRADNLGPLTRKVHRAKTARHWTVTQPEPGHFHWTSPHGFAYEVTTEGTTPLGRQPHTHAA